jgi:hypothetical protein
VSTLASLLPPFFNLHQGDAPQCLSVVIQTYQRICTSTSFCNSVHHHNNIRPRKGLPSPFSTMKSLQNKVICDNLTPLSTSWHIYPIFAPKTTHPDYLFSITSSPDHVAASASLCLGMIRIHLNHVSPKTEKLSCPSNLSMLQFIYSHNPLDEGKSSNHLLSSSHLSITQHPQ